MISPQTRELIARALAEDVGPGDITTESTVPGDVPGFARVVVKSPGVLAGTEAFRCVYEVLNPRVQCVALMEDGSRVFPRDVVMEISGPAASILTGERVAMNMLGRLSGVASLTRQFVEATSGYHARIYDTRKTTPCWRELERHAVLAGGGCNHRFGLFDMVLIKDNHIAAAGGVKPAIEAARKKSGGLYTIEVETSNLDEVREALEGNADIIMLDNMKLETMRTAVGLINGRAITEASGSVNLGSVREIAQTGVDRISVGALTHSAKAVDMSMRMDPVKVTREERRSVSRQRTDVESGADREAEQAKRDG